MTEEEREAIHNLISEKISPVDIDNEALEEFEEISTIEEDYIISPSELDANFEQDNLKTNGSDNLHKS